MAAHDPGDAASGGEERPATARRRARAAILADPDLVLADAEIMSALLDRSAALDGRVDRRIVDLRDARIARLESSLSRLKAAHRDIVESAWDTLSGLDRARALVLRLLDAGDPAAAVARAEVDAPIALDADRVVVRAGRAPARLESRLAKAEDAALFGEASLGSVAIAPLAAREGDPAWGVLAVAACDPQRFGGGRGDELVAFVAAALGRIAAPA